MAAITNLRNIVLVCLAFDLYLVYGGVVHTELHGDGPWRAQEAIQHVERTSEQKLVELEKRKQEEKRRILEHEGALKKDIETQFVINQKITLKESIECKLKELEKQYIDIQHEGEVKTLELEKEMQAVELKKHEVELGSERKLGELEKQKHELELKKLDVAKGIEHQTHELEHQKVEEHIRIQEHESAVKAHTDEELHVLEHEKHDIEVEGKIHERIDTADHHIKQEVGEASSHISKGSELELGSSTSTLEQSSLSIKGIQKAVDDISSHIDHAILEHSSEKSI